jgi:hypothetical protein
MGSQPGWLGAINNMKVESPDIFNDDAHVVTFNNIVSVVMLQHSTPKFHSDASDFSPLKA